MKRWSITCKFIGEGKSIVAEITQEAYESYTETPNEFEACFHSIGTYLDERYHGSEIVADLQPSITLILLDFLKKTSSFANIIKTGIPYAAFTFFRANDWTEDDPNYRYRFLGSYKDQYSDDKLWAGNKFFCLDDYHTNSYVHNLLSNTSTDHDHFNQNITHNDTGLMFSNLNDRTNVKRYMLDIPEKVESLMSRLKSSLPIQTTISSYLVRDLSDKSPGVTIPKRCNIVDVVYAGDQGGILCCLDIDSKDPYLVSITFLSFNRHHHLTREIEAYQRHRIKKMKQQPTFH